MITETSTDPLERTISRTYDKQFAYSICWGAVLGGTLAAVGIHILLGALGIGAGLAIFSPVTDTDPVAHFSASAAVIWSVCALVALWFGGFVAGRSSHAPHSGFVHGILVWSLTLIISMVFISTASGLMMGGALKMLGEGLGVGSKAVASGVGDLAKDGIKRGTDQLASFISEAVQAPGTNATPTAITKATREIGFAVTKLFTPGSDIASTENRSAVRKALMDHSSMSEADATKMIDSWTESYKSLKTELDNLKRVAAEKAREAAELAATNVSYAAMGSFLALLVGMVVTGLAGSYGATRAMRAI